jgi:hypothetical protein
MHHVLTTISGEIVWHVSHARMQFPEADYIVSRPCPAVHCPVEGRRLWKSWDSEVLGWGSLDPLGKQTSAKMYFLEVTSVLSDPTQQFASLCVCVCVCVSVCVSVWWGLGDEEAVEIM